MSEPAVVVIEVEQQTPLRLLRLGLLAPRGCQAVRLLVQPGVVRAAVECHGQHRACLRGAHGGQKTGEMLTETVRRELLEETGYSVTPLRLSGIYERVSEGRDEGMCHKIYFIFLCRLNSGSHVDPSERDRFQIGTDWVPLREIGSRNLFPRAIRDNIRSLTGYGETIYIGSEKER